MFIIKGTLKRIYMCLYVTQGNGHERDFLNDERVFILDMYNKWIYPGDRHAKQAISRKVELDHHTNDDVYLEHVKRYVHVCTLFGKLILHVRVERARQGNTSTADNA